ncbi:hypothetical protein CDCA_CDCA20G4812 [Cyanidium caldarium]|uniref:Membrane insertase YidC/Oxa/ALB C-terminal domain-containing protein n=1 Tax=Cyanidium caldarium TaxID=2771 RepID=A0AAV9J2H1_CYACA|nr:hypothetical protein CDCA_CDCA20G4812 [Cyanidium caldarium]
MASVLWARLRPQVNQSVWTQAQRVLKRQMQLDVRQAERWRRGWRSPVSGEQLLSGGRAARSALAPPSQLLSVQRRAFSWESLRWWRREASQSSTSPGGSGAGGGASASDAGATAAGSGGVVDASTITDAAAATYASWYDPVMNSILQVHAMTGLPWWLTVAAITVAVRLVVLPMSLVTMRNTAAFSQAKPVLDVLRVRMSDALDRNDVASSRLAQAQMMEVMKMYNVKPFWNVANAVLQAPIFLGFFLALRKLAETHPDTLALGGIGFFSNLAVPDPYMIMPLLMSASTVAMVRVNNDVFSSMTSPTMKYFMYAFAALIVPLTSPLPAIIFCYFIPNNLISLLQTLILRYPAIRRALGLPQLAGNAVPTTGAAAAGAPPPRIMSFEEAAATYARRGQTSAGWDGNRAAESTPLYEQPPPSFRRSRGRYNATQR